MACFRDILKSLPLINNNKKNNLKKTLPELEPDKTLILIRVGINFENCISFLYYFKCVYMCVHSCVPACVCVCVRACMRYININLLKYMY